VEPGETFHENIQSSAPTVSEHAAAPGSPRSVPGYFPGDDGLSQVLALVGNLGFSRRPMATHGCFQPALRLLSHQLPSKWPPAGSRLFEKIESGSGGCTHPIGVP